MSVLSPMQTKWPSVGPSSTGPNPPEKHDDFALHHSYAPCLHDAGSAVAHGGTSAYARLNPPIFGRSSTMPLQSLSMPSQTSAAPGCASFLVSSQSSEVVT